MSDVLIRFASVSLFLVAGCGGEKEAVVRAPAEGGKLVFVTTLRAPPYTYVDEKTKDFAGIDVEIARAAAKKLGLPLEICRKPFEDLLPSVKSGKADFAANALTITPARAKNVNFSHSYARDGSAFLYRAGEPPPTIPRANDLRVGTMMTSTCHFYLCYHDIDPFCYGDYTEAEMAMAKSIQANVLPSRFPPYPNLTDKIDLFARMITAKEVGGDFYFVKSNKLAIVIADVSGKGVPAALFMMRAKATLQGHLKGGLDIVEAVVKTNDQLARDNDANMFVTAWIGIVDLATGEVEYVNAGHNPPLVRRADGVVDYLMEKSGPPLAAMDGVTYRRRTLALAPGDGILLYTDGVTEATNPDLTLYGEDRLKRSVGSLGTQGSTALIDGILEDVDAFADGAEQADDITMLGFRLVART